MILRRFTALAVSLALLCGLPYVAVAVLEWPALDLSRTEVLARLRGGSLPPGLGSAVLIIVLWTVWGLYLFAAIAEASAWVRGRAPRLRPLGPLQVVAATAIGASLTSPAAAHAATAQPATVAESPTTDPEPSPQPTSTDPGDLPGVGDQIIERERVVDGFGYGSAALTEQMKAELAPTVSMIRTHGVPEEPVRVTGYTDAAGDAAYNQELSQRRAEAVADYLRDQFDESAPEIQAHGEGETQLLDGVGAASQRRAEIAYTVTPQPAPRPPERPDASAPGQEPENAPSPTPTEDASQQEADNSALDSDGQAVIVVKLPGSVLVTSTGAAGIAAGFAVGRRRSRTQSPVQSAAPAQDAADGDRAASQTSPRAAPEEPEARHPDVDASAVIDLSTGGLGITGPGAPGAARALLAAALIPDQEPSLHLVIPRNDAEALLGPETATLLSDRATTGVTVTPNLDDALTLLLTELLARSSDDDEEDAPDAADPVSAKPCVLVATPDEEHTAELHALLAQGRRSGVAALLLGAWPQGTCAITAEHTVATTDPEVAHLSGARWPSATPQSIAALLAAFSPSPDQPESEQQPSASTEPSPSTPTRTVEDGEEPATRKGSGERGRARENAARPRPVRLHLLGPIALTVDGETVEVSRHSAYEVAAYLAAHPRGIRRDEATEAMWPDEKPRRVMHRFHDAISTLRGLLRPTRGDEAPSPVIRKGERYHLDPALVEADLWDLTTALNAAEHADHTTQRHERLHNALALYTGDLASEADYRWIEPLRIEVRTRLVHQLRDHAQHLGEHATDDAVHILEQALTLDPTAEPTYEALINLHLSRGNTPAAQRSYERYTQEMARINTAPSAHLRALIDGVKPEI